MANITCPPGRWVTAGRVAAVVARAHNLPVLMCSSDVSARKCCRRRWANSCRGYETGTWFGIGAPKNTPPEVIDKLNKEINAVLADPGIAEDPRTVPSPMPSADTTEPLAR